MRSFLAGLILGGLLLISSLLLDNTDTIMSLLLIIGVVPMVIGGFLSGAFVSGDRVRANYSDSEGLSERTNIASKLFLFGIPCLLAGIASYFIKY